MFLCLLGALCGCFPTPIQKTAEAEVAEDCFTGNGMLAHRLSDLIVVSYELRN